MTDEEFYRDAARRGRPVSADMVASTLSDGSRAECKAALAAMLTAGAVVHTREQLDRLGVELVHYSYREDDPYFT